MTETKTSKMASFVPGQARGEKPAPETAADFLRKALNALSDRGVLRDSPEGERSMALTVRLFEVLTGLTIGEKNGWLFMICLKLARNQQGGVNLDDYIDLAGFSSLLGEHVAKTYNSK